MARIIVLRLHPDKAVTGAAFIDYLKDLQIDAFDASFGDPSGQGAAIGSTPNLASQSKIVQHYDSTLSNAPLKAVASAMIVLTGPASPEYADPDIVLHVIRGGKTLRKLAVAYNVAVQVVPNQQDVDTFDPTSVDPTKIASYVEVPDPRLAFAPNDAVVDVPNDGTPPNFTELKAAVETVLQQDPGSPLKLGSLSVAECRHIAREISWNRHVDPMPFASNGAFEKMYTVKPVGETFAPELDINAQKEFQGVRAQYHAVHDAEAEALTKYVFALSAAIACENKSAKAARAGLGFPIQPGPTGKVQEAEVVLES